MIVAQAELDAILDRKVRKRLLELPVRYAPKLGAGDKGALKRCPMRRGGVYQLFPPLPFERFLARASEQPSRARSVLWLIDRVQRWTPRGVTITVSQPPERQGDVWLVRFVKGDEQEYFDDTLPYLSGDGGFTMVASRQAVPGDPPYCAPFAEDLEKAREDARKKRLTPAQEAVEKMRAEAHTCREVMATVKAGNRMRLIQKELQKLAAELAT